MRVCFLLLAGLLSLTGFSQRDDVVIKGIALCRPMSFGDTLPVIDAQIELSISDSIKISVPTDENGRYQLKIKRFKGKINVTCTSSKNTKIKGKRMSGVLANRDVRIIDLTSSQASVFVANFTLQEACILYRAPEILFKMNTSEPEPGSLSGENAMDSVSFLATFMKENPTTVVEITGNADPSEKDKKVLSQKRADLVVAALVAKGIQKERLKTRAMSDEQPLITEVQIKKAKTKEEKETLRLKNTRASWKILSFDYGVKEGSDKKSSDVED
jgi:outer membrane protein OmpA-like peptidoglycan-associated protein